MKIGKFLRRFDTDEGELCDTGRVARYVLEGIEFLLHFNLSPSFLTIYFKFTNFASQTHLKNYINPPKIFKRLSSQQTKTYH